MEGLIVGKTYFDRVHRWGKISSLTSLVFMFLIPLAICVHLDVWPPATTIFNGLIKIVPLFWTVAVIELITYAPMLGAGGTYLSFVTGNISNLKLPCGLNAMHNADVRPNTEEGEVISTIAIAASAITTTVIIAIGVLLFSPVLPMMTAEGSPFAPAFQQVIPALFGALGAGYFAKHRKIFFLPVAMGVVVLLFVPDFQAGTLIFITVAVSLTGAHIMYKKNMV